MKRTGLQRRSGLARGSRLKAKRPPVTSEEKLARPLVERRSGGWCELRLEKCLGPAETMHHRRKQSQGGPWTPSNLLHLCGDGVRGCHGVITNTRKQYYDSGWLVQSHEDWRVVPVVLFDGRVLLDDHGHRHDPPTDHTDDGGLTPHRDHAKEAS